MRAFSEGLGSAPRDYRRDAGLAVLQEKLAIMVEVLVSRRAEQFCVDRACRRDRKNRRSFLFDL